MMLEAKCWYAEQHGYRLAMLRSVIQTLFEGHDFLLKLNDMVWTLIRLLPLASYVS